MKQKNNSETDNCQTETIQADFENLTGEAVDGLKGLQKTKNTFACEAYASV